MEKFGIEYSYSNDIANACAKENEIFINPEFSKLLNDDELHAVLLHEKGHIELGHTENPFLNSLSSPTLNKEQAEIERESAADFYAIRNGAKHRALLSALIKCGGCAKVDRIRQARIMSDYLCILE